MKGRGIRGKVGSKGKKTYFLLPITFALFITFSLLLFTYKEPFQKDPLSTALFDSKGSLLGARIAADGQWRLEGGDSIPEKYLRALISFEDHRFYQHPGVDLLALGRALKQNLKARSVVSGGSTISMQVIRLSRKNKPRTVWEKGLEIFLALRMEMHTRKEEVLHLYAANAPFGGNVVGLEAASWRYFGREPVELSWSEAATLAVLPNAPALIHPGRNRAKLLQKRNRLLAKLLEEGQLDTMDYQLAVEEAIPLEPLPLPDKAPHLTDWYQKQGAGRVSTKLDPWMQEESGAILARHNKILSNNHIFNLAALILSNETGEVVVYQGNSQDDGSGRHGHQVDIIRSARSSGSILKPILYASMLDAGELLPGTLVPDIPTRYSGFTPHNFTREFDGAVHADEALIRSLNVPAVRLLKSYGILRFYDQLKQMNISTLTRPADDYGLTLILGGAEVSLWDVCQLYSNWARQLIHQEAGVLSSEAIYLCFDAMQKVKRPESEAGWDQFLSSHPIAWKTGTSFGFRDAWAIGVSPKYTVGVWVGNGDGEGRPGLTGSATAAPILFDLFNILPGGTGFQAPHDLLEPVVVCRESGMQASANCLESDTVWVPVKGVETPLCPYHIDVILDQSGKYRVQGDCYPVGEMIHKKWFVLPPAMAALYKNKNPFYLSLPPWKEGCFTAGDQPDLEILYPHPDEAIYLPVNASGAIEKLVLEAVHMKADALLYWFLDETYLGTTSRIHKLAIMPEKGNHLLSLTDQDGNQVSRSFRVI